MGNIESFLKGDGNGFYYRRLIYLANLNGVAPLLYKTFMNIDIVPDDVIFQLKKIYLSGLARNSILLLLQKSSLMTLRSILRVI
jgi:hypothetical protein